MVETTINADMSELREELRAELLARKFSTTDRVDAYRLFGDLPSHLHSQAARFNDICDEWKPSRERSEAKIALLCPKVFSDEVDCHSPSGWRNTDFKALVREVVHLSLYCDRLWMPDPVEIMSQWIQDYAYPSIAQGAEFGGERGWQQAYEALKAFQVLQPLADAGYVAYYPHTALYYGEVAEILFEEKRPFRPDELASAWPDLYVAEGLAYASSLDISYAAITRAESQAISRAIDACRTMTGVVDARMIAAVPRLELPHFESLDPSTIVRVRKEDESFAAFRTVLRRVGESLTAGLEDPSFDAEVRRIEAEVLTPEIEKLLRSVSTVSSLKENLAKSGIEFSATAMTCFTLTGEPVSAILTGAVTGASSAIVKTIASRTRATPASNIVFQLSSKHSRQAIPGRTIL